MACEAEPDTVALAGCSPHRKAPDTSVMAWDNGSKIAPSFYHPSPRVVAIPLFDPVYYDTGKRTAATPA